MECNGRNCVTTTVLFIAIVWYWWFGPLGRHTFPEGFIFGAASAAYQVEGGRKPSIWDTFTHKYPEKIRNGSNGDVAVDSYHLYQEDVKHLKQMNMDAYRFSISWSRILPDGTLEGGINQEGIQYYNNLTNALVSKGLKPFVTIFHWDVPQALEDKYGGFRSEKIVQDFQDYAGVCFKEFGDRVKHWITMNEPRTVCTHGYVTGTHAPGRCSPSVDPACTCGNSGTEPYIVGHNMLLAHAATVNLYRKTYQGSQKGSIGISVSSPWFLPLSMYKPHDDAFTRAIDFSYGWFLDPLTSGDYPFIMRALVGDRLPNFTEDESRMLNGSYDFIGVNYYTSNYVFHDASSAKHNEPTYISDSRTNTTGFGVDGKPIGPQAASKWEFVYSSGIKEILVYTKNKYNDPIIYITENGIDETNQNVTLEEALNDNHRISYIKEHLHKVQQAIRRGVRVKGYFSWSLLDNFEWADGYDYRFGLLYVDYNDGRKRYPKKSTKWMAEILKRDTFKLLVARLIRAFLH